MIRKMLYVVLAAVTVGAVTMAVGSRHEIARYRAITKM
jgi:hypothetical protein